MLILSVLTLLAVNLIADVIIYCLLNEPALLRCDLMSGFADSRRFLAAALLVFLISVLWYCFRHFLRERPVLVISFRGKEKKREFRVPAGKNRAKDSSDGLGKKEKNRGIAAILLTAAAVCMAGGLYGYSVSVSEKTERMNTDRLIHAFGLIDGVDYTNSLEALEQHYASGERWFETDFLLTSDGVPVAFHEWEEWDGSVDGEYVPTAEEFLDTPILGKYTPLSWSDIVEYMEVHPDMYIVTDTKYGSAEEIADIFCRMRDIAEEKGAQDVLDRLAVQFYNQESCEAIRQVYPFRSYIYTLYREDWHESAEEFTQFCRFCAAGRAASVTMWDYIALDHPEFIHIADRYGLDIYVHTVNDSKEAKQLFELGVKGIYTDDEATVLSVQ